MDDFTPRNITAWIHSVELIRKDADRALDGVPADQLDDATRIVEAGLTEALHQAYLGIAGWVASIDIDGIDVARIRLKAGVLNAVDRLRQLRDEPLIQPCRLIDALCLLPAEEHG